MIYRKVQDNKRMYPAKQESESEDLDDLAKLDYIMSKDRKNSAKTLPSWFNSLSADPSSGLSIFSF